MAMRAKARLTLRCMDDDMPGAFGLGCVELLQGVEEEHSLNKATQRMGMAYSKAWRIMKEAEAQLGCKLLDRDGARGSSLTPEGKAVMDAYLQLQAEVRELLDRRVPELFGAFGAAGPVDEGAEADS